jgi:hypothetical protein
MFLNASIIRMSTNTNSWTYLIRQSGPDCNCVFLCDPPSLQTNCDYPLIIYRRNNHPDSGSNMQSIGKAFILFTAVVLLVTVAQASPFGLPAGSIHTSLENRLHSGVSYSAPQVSISNCILGRYGIGCSATGLCPATPSNSIQGAYVKYPGDSQWLASGEVSPGTMAAAASIAEQEYGTHDPLVLIQFASGSLVVIGSGNPYTTWPS